LAEISNLDKQPLELATNKPADPVTANLPAVTEEFTAISTKIEISIDHHLSVVWDHHSCGTGCGGMDSCHSQVQGKEVKNLAINKKGV
jgi:hypothetical protein